MTLKYGLKSSFVGFILLQRLFHARNISSHNNIHIPLLFGKYVPKDFYQQIPFLLTTSVQTLHSPKKVLKNSRRQRGRINNFQLLCAPPFMLMMRSIIADS